MNISLQEEFQVLKRWVAKAESDLQAAEARGDSIETLEALESWLAECRQHLADTEAEIDENAEIAKVRQFFGVTRGGEIISPMFSSAAEAGEWTRNQSNGGASAKITTPVAHTTTDHSTE